MKFDTLLTAVIGLPLILVGCADKGAGPEHALSRPGNHLTVLDAEQNVLVDEEIPTRGLTALDIVIREGRRAGVDGVFIQFNTNTRFVPWADFVANPLGQRIPSHRSIRAAELDLRLAEGSCDGRAPLVFQVRELRAKVRRFKTARTLSAQPPSESSSLEDLTYTTLSGWTESGLYVPDQRVTQARSRWIDRPCPAGTNAGSIERIGQALDKQRNVAPALAHQQPGATVAPAALSRPADRLLTRRQAYQPANTEDGYGK